VVFLPLTDRKARYEAKRSARLALDPDARKARNKAREEKRRERMRADPDFARKVNRQRKSAAKLKARNAADARPFVGCDGEGAGRGSDHKYLLFRMGDRALETGSRLTTPELLSFIVAHPDAKAILVAFAFEYDISNILRDVPVEPEQGDRGPEPSRLERVLRIDKGIMEGQANPYDRAFGWVWLKFPGYPEFGVSYIPRNYLKVCLASTFTLMVNGRPKTFKQSVPGSSRTIFDTFGFFQCSFLKAIETWGVGVEHHSGIAAMKDARSTFEGITPAIRDYCAIECRLLAELMTQFREVCLGAGLRPKTWNGPGKIAAALLAEHGAMTAIELEKKTPAVVLELAHAAYYGGRFEVTRVGSIAEKVWEHDINSAYPAAMLDLPCLDHGRWIKTPAVELAGLDALFVAPVRFSHARDQFLCGLPFRSKSGRLSWPRHGNGVYWSHEIRSAERLGAKIEYRDGYRFEQKCECQNFGWIADLYEERRRVGKSLKGITLKLGYNSVYGKQAQRVGTPRWANPINAGLITAITRAKLNDAIGAARDPQDVAMIATDGIYTVAGPIPLDKGEGLGQWEVKDYPRLFVVRPGLYWPPRKAKEARRLKTRGLSAKFFEPRCGAFERAWRGYIPTALDNWTGPPIVGVEVETFVGLRLAFRLGRPADACQWIKKTIECKFEWSGDKRAGFAHTLDGKGLILFSKAGSPDAHSAHYEPGAGLASAGQFELDRLLFEAMPDHVDLSPPHK
jgi:hypothetical protein